MLFIQDTQVPDTFGNVEIINRFGRRQITHVFHDIDGTHSLIRDWPPVMSITLHNVIVNGLVGVYCPELTRESVWAAFRRRQVYATSGPKIILNFQVANAPMGAEVTWPAAKGPVPVALRAVCCDPIKTIEVIRNGEVLYREDGEGVITYLLLEDPEPPPGASWYYARVLQQDGQMAWSSPVWVTLTR